MNETIEKCQDLLNPEFLKTIRSDTVYILAPGPNGRDYWDRIPLDSTCIFVNKAIELLHDESVKCQNPMWIVCETKILQTDWFNIYHDAYKDILCVGKAIRTLGAFEDDDYWKVYEYYGRTTVDEILTVDPTGLSIGTTIAGIAIQLAWHMRAETVILCGVDMFGNVYYDGTRGGYDRDRRPWGMPMNRIIKLIKNMQEQRPIDVYSLSPTKLMIPTYE